MVKKKTYFKNGEYIEEVCPLILIEMREKLSPRKPFSYKNGDHLKQAHENEKLMRKKGRKS